MSARPRLCLWAAGLMLAVAGCKNTRPAVEPVERFETTSESPLLLNQATEPVSDAARPDPPPPPRSSADLRLRESAPPQVDPTA